jgi:hypothetical protein
VAPISASAEARSQNMKINGATMNPISHNNEYIHRILTDIAQTQKEATDKLAFYKP